MVGLASLEIIIKYDNKLEDNVGPVGKQAKQSELSKRWMIHDVFHVHSFERNTTREKRVRRQGEGLVLDGGV